ncbi:MAG: transposase, partial [Deltaproteobacteria bacterium]|nr:transposase [Deltaproteobacteria bacterium]
MRATHTSQGESLSKSLNFILALMNCRLWSIGLTPVTTICSILAWRIILAQFEERFTSEVACLEYLASLRWPGGFVCPRCGANQAWRTKRWLWYCRNCGTQTSVTAGTIFHG